jgi:hypothetical protein
MNNRSKIQLMTVISPVRGWLAPVAGALLWVLKIFSFGPLRRLRTIHFARWTLLRAYDFPVVSRRQADPEPGPTYMLFTTNFNGSWDAYIDAFARLREVRIGVSSIWGSTPGFEYPRRLRNFKRQIRYYERPIDYHWSAYPHATVRDIEDALDLQRRLQEFANARLQDGAPALADAYDLFLRDNAALLRSDLEQSFMRQPQSGNAQTSLSL